MNIFTLYNKLFNINKWYVFVIVALIIKFIYLFTFLKDHSDDPKKLYFLRGDAIQYVTYCENLHNEGVYYENSKNGIKVYANRTPGMCFLYNPLRVFFTKEITLTLFIIIQTILSAISTYFLALIACKIFKSERIFHICFWLYAFSTYCANYNNFILTESLAVSSMIFSIYFFLIFFEKKKNSFLFISGFFITWTILLRPFIVPFLLVFIGILLIEMYYKKKSIKSLFIFVLPIIIVFSLWTYRNYYRTNKFIPLQGGLEWYKDNSVNEARVNFMKTFGLSWLWWEPNSEHTWFMSEEYLNSIKVKRPNDNIFPQYVFTENLTMDSLKKARQYFWNYLDTAFTETQRNEYGIKTANLLNKFTDTFKKDHPLNYQIGARLRLLKNFLDQPVGAPLKSVKYPFNVFFVFLDAFINYLVILIGFLFLFSITSKSFLKDKIKYLIFFIPLLIITIFPLYLRINELRFLTLAYPFLLICLSYGVDVLLKVKYKYLFLSIIFILISILSINSVYTNIKW